VRKACHVIKSLKEIRSTHAIWGLHFDKFHTHLRYSLTSGVEGAESNGTFKCQKKVMQIVEQGNKLLVDKSAGLRTYTKTLFYIFLL
jgi:hypothetical protein